MTPLLTTAEAVAVWQDDGACIPFIKGRVALYAIHREARVSRINL